MGRWVWATALAFMLILQIASFGVGTNPLSEFAKSIQPAAAQTVVATIPIVNIEDGKPVSDPKGVGVNPVTNKIYVADERSVFELVQPRPGITDTFIHDFIKVIDGNNNSVTKTIEVGIFVPEVRAKFRALEVDTVRGGEFADKPLGVGVNPVTNKVYITTEHTDLVSVIDGNTDSLLCQLKVGDHRPDLSAPCVGPLLTINNVTPVLPFVGEIADRPFGVGVNPVTNKIYVALGRGGGPDGAVSVIDGNTDTQIGLIHIPLADIDGSIRPPGPVGVGVNPVTNKIYVANHGASTVSVIDGKTDTIVNTINLRPPRVAGVAPFGVGVNTVTNKIYVSNFSAHTVSVINGTDTVIKTIPFGQVGIDATNGLDSPQFVGVNEKTNKIYVANHDSAITGLGTVIVINGNLDLVIGRVGLVHPSSAKPVGLAVNSETHKIYVASLGPDGSSALPGAVSVIEDASPAPTCLTPPSGLVSWWPGDESANDIGDANNPSAQSGVSIVAGKVGNGISLASGGFIDIPDNSNLKAQTFTIDAWVKPKAPSTNPDSSFGDVIFQKAVGLNTAPQISYHLGWSSHDSKFKVALGHTGGSTTFHSSGAYAPDQFHHVAITYDGVVLKLYVNGRLDSSLTINKPIFYSTEQAAIGSNVKIFRDVGFLRTWQGVIDELEFYSMALSESEIQSMFNFGSAGKCKVPPPPQLTVIKNVTNDNGGTASASDFTITVTGNSPTPASFAGSSTGTTVTLNAGAYSVSETGPSGYSSSLSADCTGSIAVGETKTCTITNDDPPPLPTPEPHSAILEEVQNIEEKLDGTRPSLITQISNAITNTILPALTSIQDALSNIQSSIAQMLGILNRIDTETQNIENKLDNTIEMKRVTLQVIELKEKEEFLVYATESGVPVNVQFIAVQVSDEDKITSFVDVTAQATVSVVKLGVHKVVIDLPKNAKDAKIFEFRVKHVHDGLDHFGATLFDRGHDDNLGMGQ